jgi:hypothetical protein
MLGMLFSEWARMIGLSQRVLVDLGIPLWMELLEFVSALPGDGCSLDKFRSYLTIKDREVGHRHGYIKAKKAFIRKGFGDKRLEDFVLRLIACPFEFYPVPDEKGLYDLDPLSDDTRHTLFSLPIGCLTCRDIDYLRCKWHDTACRAIRTIKRSSSSVLSVDVGVILRELCFLMRVGVLFVREERCGFESYVLWSDIPPNGSLLSRDFFKFNTLELC